MTDPIADLFTRVRNGLMVQHGAVEMPNSKVKTRIAEVFKRRRFYKKTFKFVKMAGRGF